MQEEDWAHTIARKVKERRKEKKHVVATGITPSGHIHLGNVREIITADAIYSALMDMDVEARLIYIADTYDALRERYPFLPEEYGSHVGKPLSEIPDAAPEECHTSYAEHFLQPFLDSLKELSIKIELFRADEIYKSGLYREAIKEAILKRKKIAKIIEEVTGRKLPEEWYPFNPICDACGRITSTVMKGYNEKKEEVHYVCNCGNEGETSLKGGGKLVWRVDWAARWKILEVTIEPFGKDHAVAGGSYETGKRISSEIYNYEAPYPIPFEHILMNKAKMSSSKGTNVPVQEILKVTPPEILKYIIRRVKPERHIEFDPNLGLLNLIDEYERKKGEKIPFKHLINAVQIARGNFKGIIEVLKRSGYEVNEKDEKEIREIRKKSEYAEEWLKKYAPSYLKFQLKEKLPLEAKKLSEEQKNSLRILSKEIKEDRSGEYFHNKIYEVAEKEGIKAKKIFEAVYLVLLGRTSGPRAGWFLASLDKKFLKERFEEALTSSPP